MAVHLDMRKKLARFLVFAVLLAAGMLLLAAGVSAEAFLQAGMEITPDTMAYPGIVTVNIYITNTRNDGAPVSVTLLDPDGAVCTGFGNGGTARLASGTSFSYAGTWMVTQAQLEGGRITYSARYTFTNANGEHVAVSSPIAASIGYSPAKASFRVDRRLPGDSVAEGETVTISYEITNQGTVDIWDISIADTDINDEVITCPLLKVGDTVELSTYFVADASQKTTNALISYSYTVDNETITDSLQLDAKMIHVTTPGLIVALTASELTVDAGEQVDLTCVITNRSDLSYEQLTVADKTLGDIARNLSLGTGESDAITREILVNGTGTYQFIIDALDSTGARVRVLSNEVTVASRQGTVDSPEADAVPESASTLLAGALPLVVMALVLVFAGRR